MNFTQQNSGLLTPFAPETPQKTTVFAKAFSGVYADMDAESAIARIRGTGPEELVAYMEIPGVHVVIYRHTHELSFEELT